jgi:hypothetical protein
VDVVPADRLALADVAISAIRAGVALDAGDPLAGAAVDAPELLDVNVDQLSGDGPLVAGLSDVLCGAGVTDRPVGAGKASDVRPEVDI